MESVIQTISAAVPGYVQMYNDGKTDLDTFQKMVSEYIYVSRALEGNDLSEGAKAQATYILETMPWTVRNAAAFCLSR